MEIEQNVYRNSGLNAITPIYLRGRGKGLENLDFRLCSIQHFHSNSFFSKTKGGAGLKIYIV